MFINYIGRLSNLQPLEDYIHTTYIHTNGELHISNSAIFWLKWTSWELSLHQFGNFVWPIHSAKNEFHHLIKFYGETMVNLHLLYNPLAKQAKQTMTKLLQFRLKFSLSVRRGAFFFYTFLNSGDIFFRSYCFFRLT